MSAHSIPTFFSFFMYEKNMNILNYLLDFFFFVCVEERPSLREKKKRGRVYSSCTRCSPICMGWLAARSRGEKN